MYKVETEILADRQARLVVTVEQERVEKELKAAAQRIAKRYTIPGFRKGKAPYAIIRQYFGDAAVYEEAVDELGQEAFRHALEHSGLEPYAPGKLEDMSADPMVLTFMVPLLPDVNLGDYRAVRVEAPSTELEEGAVEDTLQELRERQAKFEKVERPVENGDVAVLNFQATLLGEDDPEKANWLQRENARVLISEEATYPVPGFPPHIVGMNAEGEKTFEITLGDDEDLSEELRGKTLRFEVKCVEVLKYELPEADDAFAASVSEFSTIDELKQDIATRLQDYAKQAAQDSFVDSIVNKMLETAQIAYPPIMLEEEIDQRVERIAKRLEQSGIQMADYLRLSQMSEEQLRESVREEAEQRLRSSLILSEVINAEGLSVSEEEIADEIATMTLSFGTQAALARQFLASKEARVNVLNKLLTEKAIERIKLIALGQAPDLEAPATQVSTEEASV